MLKQGVARANWRCYKKDDYSAEARSSRILRDVLERRAPKKTTNEMYFLYLEESLIEVVIKSISDVQQGTYGKLKSEQEESKKGTVMVCPEESEESENETVKMGTMQTGVCKVPSSEITM